MAPSMTRALIAACALGPVPATAQAAGPAAAAIRVDAGTALARLTYPAAMDEALMTFSFSKEVAPAYRADPKLRALDARHPGLIDALVAALRLEYRKARAATMPVLWARTGAAYAASLDVAELRQAIAFHDGPTGRRTIELMIHGIANGSPPARGADPVVIHPAEPTPADAAAQAAFDATSTGRKLVLLRTTVAAINADWSSSAVPDEVVATAALASIVAAFGVSAGDLAGKQR